MVRGGVVNYGQDRMNGSCFGIIRSVHQAADAGMKQRTRAHGARLNCSKQFAAAQTMVAEDLTGRAQGDDFGMGGGIVVGQVAIVALRDDAAVADDDRADRHFAGFERTLGSAKGFFHPQFVLREFAGGELGRRRQSAITSGKLPANQVRAR